MAFAMGMPLEKIRAILGGEIKSTTGGSDIGNTDYQSNISDIQDDWENLMNTQFFNETFQVNMKFSRTAARDEIAEVQRDAQKLNNLQTFQQMDLIKEDRFVDFAEQMFPNIPSMWWNPNPNPEPMGGMGIGSAPIPGKGQASEALSAEKKKQQLPQQRNKPPTGTKELFQIDLDRFKDEVRQAGITSESKNKVELSEQGTNIHLYMNPIGLNKTFMTVVPKAEFTNMERFIFGPIAKKGKRVS